MISLIRVATVTVVTLAALVVAPAAAQAYVGPPPADCTVSEPTDHSRSLTCTQRPAGQQWRLRVWCFPFGKLVTRYGNVVTGNGTSTADCNEGVPIGNPQFQTV